MSANTKSEDHGRCQHEAKPGATILVVEDEVSVLKVLIRLLTLHGYTVLAADSGRAALPLWAKHQNAIDLLLTDVVLPGALNGQDIADQFQRAKPSLQVIFTSGYTQGLLHSELHPDKQIRFVQKPYRPEQLLEEVRSALVRQTPIATVPC